MSRSSTSVLLLASSPVALTFLLRPFSNTLETLFLAVTALLVKSVMSIPSGRTLIVLGAVLALGVFTRITFVAFVLPLVISAAYKLAMKAICRQGVLYGSSLDLPQSTRSPFVPKQTRHPLPALNRLSGRPLFHHHLPCPRSRRHHLFHLSPPCAHLLPRPHTPQSPPLQPFFRQPRQPRTASAIPSHCRQLADALRCWAGDCCSSGGVEISSRAVLASRFVLFLVETLHCRSPALLAVLVASFVVPTLLLSIQPHQEPRFLLPLIVPLVLLAPHAPFLRASSGAMVARKWFWVHLPKARISSEVNLFSPAVSLARPLASLHHPLRLPPPRRCPSSALCAQWQARRSDNGSWAGGAGRLRFLADVYAPEALIAASN
jgi:hypothetical protein